jgi:disulfide bond formation protein DsbB
MKFIKHIPYITWGVALLAVLFSLYFSEILKLPPCVLCWYQRIMAYPLVFIIGTGILRKDPNLPYYVLPLSITGFLIAAYHNLLYYGVIPEKLTPCSTGLSCAARQLELWGVITIPLLSLLTFAFISIAMIIYRRHNNE